MLGKPVLICLIYLAWTGVLEVRAQFDPVTIISGITTVVPFLYKMYVQYSSANNVPEFNETVQFVMMRNSLDAIKAKLDMLSYKDSDITMMKSRIYEMNQNVGMIMIRYNEFIKYSSKKKEYENSTLASYYQEVLNEDVGLPYVIRNLHTNIVGMGKDSLVNIMENYIEDLEPYCRASESRQYYFYYFFLSYFSYEIKGYLTIRYAFELKKEIEKRPFIKEINDALVAAKERLRTATRAFKEVMERVSQVIWRCDPAKHVPNKSFVELENVFRRLLHSAKDFTDDYDKLECKATCPGNEINRVQQTKCKKNNCLLPQRPCSNVKDCNVVSYRGSLDICIAGDSSPAHNGRRYEYVKSHDDGLLAPWKDHHCSKSGFRIVQTFSEGMSWGEECDACNCICDEKEHSDRYISLKPVTSNVQSNFVVTGVKFVKENHTIHIQIQQGKLLPYAFVNNNTVHWKQIEDVSADMSPRRTQIDILTLDNKISPVMYDVQPQIPADIFELDWDTKRGLYLDDMVLNKNELVTGVRFAEAQSVSKTYLKLDIQATPFDFSTGQLLKNKSYWYSDSVDISLRTLLDLQNAESPVLLNDINIPNNKTHQYVLFEPSGIKRKDAGQTTLPLIDIQPVYSNPPVPLSGLSLDVKKTGDSGGFLILKSKTYNILWNFNH